MIFSAPALTSSASSEKLARACESGTTSFVEIPIAGLLGRKIAARYTCRILYIIRAFQEKGKRESIPIAYEAETYPVFPTAYEAEIGILDRSSTHGDRYERI